MRVALVCPYAWDAPGGVQVHVRQLAAFLERRGDQVRILAPALSVGGDRGVDVVGKALRLRYQGTVAPIAPDPRVLVRVRRALAAFGPDVVHVHEPLTPSASMAAALVATVPTVATFHAYAERSALFDMAAPILRPVWRRLAVRMAVSEAARRFVSARFDGEVRVVPNGVDVGLFADASATTEGGRRLVWVGRLDPQKGFRVALAAFETLATDLADLRLVVIGEGPDRKALADLSAGARARVSALGTVAHDDLPRHMAGATAFLSPALGQESFGITLVEAMAAGVPVVASDVDGYREVVRHGIDGLLVPPGDPRALSSALRRVLADPDLADRLRTAGRARADGYRWDRVGEQIVAAYREAMGGNVGPGR